MNSPIYTKEDWQKVRKLNSQSRIVPSWLYIIGAIIASVVIFNENLINIWWIILFICVCKLYGREDQEKGYVDGWYDGQDYVTTDRHTIDELISTMENAKKKNL